MRTVCLLIAMLWLPSAVQGKIDIKSVGAVGDGVSIDSPAINAALETASKNGGDTVVVPEGIYLCYSIHLQSNITLRLEKGAVLKAARVRIAKATTRQSLTIRTIRTSATAIGTTPCSGESICII